MPKITELITQIPVTDKELQTATEGKTPAAKAPESKFTGPAPDVVKMLIAQLVAGGETLLAELLDEIRDPSAEDFRDYRAEYLLHCLVLHAGTAGQETLRKSLAAAVAQRATKADVPAAVKNVLLRELDWIATAAEAQPVAALLTDAETRSAAARVLLTIGGKEATDAFRAALPQADAAGRPMILHALATLGDAKSIDAFRAALQSDDRETRLTAAAGLARLGDPSAVEGLLALASAEGFYERTQAANACLDLAERLTAAKNPAATNLCRKLADSRTPREEHIRQAAHKLLGTN